MTDSLEAHINGEGNDLVLQDNIIQCFFICLKLNYMRASLVAQMVKNRLQCRRPKLDPGLGRSLGEGNDNPL